METIKRKYIADENNNKIVVQLDIETLNRIEEAFENYALYKCIEEAINDDVLGIAEAKEFYNNLDKKQ